MESFESTRIQKEQFMKVFERALDEGLTADRLQQISETFWFYFCYHLRLHRDCHENVSAETLRIWREALPEAGEVYGERMQNYAYYLFPDGSDDPVIKELLKDRRERLDKLGSIMTGWDAERAHEHYPRLDTCVASDVPDCWNEEICN